MKKTVLSTATIFCFLLLLFWNPVFVHTETAEPSPGYTLAAGESSCGSCHTGSDEVLDSSLLSLKSILSPSIISGYVVGQTHHLNINMAGIQVLLKRGFEITAIDQNGNGAGNFVITNSSSTSKNTIGNKQYVGHKNAAGTAAWTFDWQAPVTDIGPVTFFYTGVASNDDDQPTGDKVYRGRAVVTTSSFTPLDLTSIRPINADDVQILKIFPNPFSAELRIEYFMHGENRVSFELFDLNGKSVKVMDEQVPAPGYLQRNFSFEEKLTPGIYLLKITEGEKVYFKKLVKE